jgi:hypothetical protein
LTDHPAGNPHPQDSQRQIKDLHVLVAVGDAFAPDGVEIGEGPFPDSLLGGFCCGLQFLNAITCSHKRVSVFRPVRLVAEPAVPRNNLGVIVGERENFFGGGNRAVDSAVRSALGHSSD